MKNNRLNSTALLTSLICLGAAPGLVEAADAKARGLAEPPGNGSGGGFYLNGTLGFNVSAKYSGFGIFPRQTLNGAGTATAGDRVYDDGFNLIEVPDQSALDTRTFIWGFASDTQLNLPRPGTTAISFNSSTAAAVLGGRSVTGDPQPGFEMGYAHRLGELGRGSWGFKAGFGYLNVSLEDRRTYTGDVTRDTDTFATAPAIIPASPTAPPLIGGARIENVPTAPRVTTTVAGGLTSNGPRSVNADLFALKLGPYYELPLCRQFSVSLSGGLVVAAISSQFSFSEVNNIASINPFPGGAASATQTFTGSNDKMEMLPGGFVDLRANYHVNDRWSVFAGGQYQYLSSFSQSASGRTAKLDFGKTLLVHFGASYSF